MKQPGLDLETKRLIIRDIVWTVLIACAIVGMIAFSIWPAAERYFDARYENETQEATNAALIVKQEELENQFRETGDSNFIEKEIRENLGKVKPGEIPYIAADYNAKNLGNQKLSDPLAEPVLQTTDEVAAAEKSKEPSGWLEYFLSFFR